MKGLHHVSTLAALASLLAAPLGGQLAPVGPEVTIHADPEAHLETPAVAADAAGSALVCWQRTFMQQVQCGLFDSDLLPLRPPEHLNGDDLYDLSTPVEVASNGTDFAVAWAAHGRHGGLGTFGRAVGPQGRPAPATRQLSEPSDWFRVRPSLGRMSDGSFVAAWKGQAEPFGGVGFFGRRFDADLEPLGPEVLLTTLPGVIGEAAVAPDAEGRFLLVWTVDAPEMRGVFARLFEASGGPAGPAQRLDQATERLPGGTPAVARLEDRFLVVWQSDDRRSGTTSIRGRIVDAAGRPLGRELRLAQRETGFLRLPAVAADPAAGFIVTWDGEDGDDLGILARRFDREGTALSGDVLVNASPDGGQAWSAITSTGPGRFAVVWQHVTFDGGYATIRGRTLEAPGPIPPGGSWLASPAVSGFDFKVRISGGAGSIAGALEPGCIPETVCVSGALPGRSEVFLRVVGPKPNGRMWPTLVKFSTSTVEVWVRQDGTGELRYYRLEGARPGVDELPGLFDREGFAP